MSHFTIVYKDAKLTLNLSIFYSQCRFDYQPLPASTLKVLSGRGPDSRERRKSCLATMKLVYHFFFQPSTQNNCFHWSFFRWAHVITNQNEGNCSRDYFACATPVYDKIWKVFHTLEYHKANLYSYKSQKTYFPLESLNFLQIILQSWMSCRTCSNSASCCLFSFWKKVNLFFILFVVSSFIQFLNASSRSFSFSINKSCCLCASRNLLSKPRIFSRQSVPSSPFFATFCQLCTSVRTCTCENYKISFVGRDSIRPALQTETFLERNWAMKSVGAGQLRVEMRLITRFWAQVSNCLSYSPCMTFGDFRLQNTLRTEYDSG